MEQNEVTDLFKKPNTKKDLKIVFDLLQNIGNK